MPVGKYSGLGQIRSGSISEEYRSNSIPGRADSSVGKFRSGPFSGSRQFWSGPLFGVGQFPERANAELNYTEWGVNFAG